MIGKCRLILRVTSWNFISTHLTLRQSKAGAYLPAGGRDHQPKHCGGRKTPLDELLPALHDALGGKGRLFAQVMATTAGVEDARKLRAIINDRW